MPADGVDRIEVFGAGWSALAHPNPRPLTVWDDQRAHHPLSHEMGDGDGGGGGMLTEQLRAFLDAVRGDAPVPVGARYEDGIRVAMLLDKLKESARTGRPVWTEECGGSTSSSAEPTTRVTTHVAEEHTTDGSQGQGIVLTFMSNKEAAGVGVGVTALLSHLLFLLLFIYSLFLRLVLVSYTSSMKL